MASACAAGSSLFASSGGLPSARLVTSSGSGVPPVSSPASCADSPSLLMEHSFHDFLTPLHPTRHEAAEARSRGGQRAQPRQLMGGPAIIPRWERNAGSGRPNRCNAPSQRIRDSLRSKAVVSCEYARTSPIASPSSMSPHVSPALADRVPAGRSTSDTASNPFTECSRIGQAAVVIRTVGVEEESLLARASSPGLVAAGDAVVAAAEIGSDGQFEHEFKREQAELGTAPQQSMADLAEDLVRRRAELANAAHRQGTRLLASATSPLDEHATSTAGDRYARMTSLFGRVARMQLTCGMHIHVAVDSPTEGAAVLDRMRGWLAVLLALSANSPFLGGRTPDTPAIGPFCGDSGRRLVWRTPSVGWRNMSEPERLSSRAGRHRRRNDLLRCTSVRSLPDGGNKGGPRISRGGTLSALVGSTSVATSPIQGTCHSLDVQRVIRLSHLLCGDCSVYRSDAFHNRETTDAEIYVQTDRPWPRNAARSMRRRP